MIPIEGHVPFFFFLRHYARSPHSQQTQFYSEILTTGPIYNHHVLYKETQTTRVFLRFFSFMTKHLLPMCVTQRWPGTRVIGLIWGHWVTGRSPGYCHQETEEWINRKKCSQGFTDREDEEKYYWMSNCYCSIRLNVVIASKQTEPGVELPQLFSSETRKILRKIFHQQIHNHRQPVLDGG